MRSPAQVLRVLRTGASGYSVVSRTPLKQARRVLGCSPRTAPSARIASCGSKRSPKVWVWQVTRRERSVVELKACGDSGKGCSVPG